MDQDDTDIWTFLACTPIAKAFGLQAGTVYAWRKNGHVPARHVRKFSSLTGIPMWKIRPDLYSAGADEMSGQGT